MVEVTAFHVSHIQSSYWLHSGKLPVIITISYVNLRFILIAVGATSQCALGDVNILQDFENVRAFHFLLNRETISKTHMSNTLMYSRIHTHHTPPHPPTAIRYTIFLLMSASEREYKGSESF